MIRPRTSGRRMRRCNGKCRPPARGSFIQYLHVTHRAEDTALQRKKAIELQQQWGSKPCDHPSFSREYDLGERTGNYCCTQCGATLTFREKAELMATREAPRAPEHEPRRRPPRRG